MPFGLRNGEGTFERLMLSVCAGLRRDICLIYLGDNIITEVGSYTFEQHLHVERFKSVFNCPTFNAGHCQRSKKCSLFKHKISYLSHIRTETEVETDPQKVNFIKSWPTSTSVSDLRSFLHLGLCSYNRRFVKEFAVFANFLHSLTQKDKKFVWSTNCETAGSMSLTKAERRYRVTRKELKRLYILSRRTDPIFMADVLFCALIIVPQNGW